MQNPNAARPVLSIGARPLALEAFRTKIKLVEPPADPNASKVDIVMVTDADVRPGNRKPRKTPRHSVLLWPPRGELFPVEGMSVPTEQTTVYKDGKAATLAARFWALRVAYEVAAAFPEDQREDAHKLAVTKRPSLAARS